jgi:hypothetical protein
MSIHYFSNPINNRAHPEGDEVDSSWISIMQSMVDLNSKSQ